MYRLWPILLLVISGAALGEPRLVVNTGHTDDVVSVTFSPDGEHVLTASHDQTARIWDVATGRETLRLSDHDNWVTSAVYSPDGRFVATGTQDAKIAVFSVETGKEIWRKADREDQVIGVLGIASVAYLDGSRIVSADEYGHIAVWSAADGQELQRFDVDEMWPMTGDDFISAMAVWRERDILLLGTEKGRLGLFSLAEEAMVFEFARPEAGSAHEARVNDIAFSPDGSFAVSVGDDGRAIRWDMDGGQAVFEVSTVFEDESPDIPKAVAISPPDGGSFLTGHESGDMHLWSASDGEELSYGHTHEGVQINSLAFSTDGAYVVSGANEGKARLWQTSDATEVLPFEGLVDSVEVIDIHPDGRSLAAGSGYLDSEVSGWSLAAGVNLGRIVGDSRVWSLQFSPGGGWLAYTFQFDSPVYFWNYATTEEGPVFENPFGGDETAVSFSPDGRFLLAYGNGKAQIWDVGTQRQLPPPLGSFDVPAEGTEVSVTSAAWSADGQRVALGLSDEYHLGDASAKYAYVRQVDSGKWIAKLGPMEGGVNSLQFSPDSEGKYLLAARSGGASIWDVETGQERRLDQKRVIVNAAIWMPDGRHVVTGGRDRVVRVWDVRNQEVVRQFKGHTGQINAIRLLDDGEIIVSASQDGTIRLWDNIDGGEIAQLVSFGEYSDSDQDEDAIGGGWAVIDSAGRFDASDGGNVDGLHWVVDNEVVALSQLRSQFYEPGLLAKLLGFNTEPLRDVSRFVDAGVSLHPAVKITHSPDGADPVLRFTVENRGGGIGPVQVLLNGKEITDDLRPPGSHPDIHSLELSLDLDGNPFFLPDANNVVDIVTANADRSLVSRGVEVTLVNRAAAGDRKPPAPPDVWAIVVGVSDYRGDAIDLNFAHKDAADFAAALELAAQGLVSPDRVHVTLINGAPTPATRSSIQQAFKDVAGKATVSDILIIYLSGHGVTWGGVDGDYYYLLQDADSLTVTDATVREQVALSSLELTSLINTVPALKQVLVLDTCAAGQLVSDLVKSRGVSSAQMRSIVRMQDRTGMFVLAGSAADAVSYEASPYGQGLLTYSLLTGMRGPALREDEFVDVNKLFGFASDEVQKLASRLGGIQQPRVSVPKGGESFDIGRISPTDRGRIKVASPKPVVITSIFQDEQLVRDHLHLGSTIDAALRESAAGQNAKFIFFANPGYPDAYGLAGRYHIDGDRITVNVVISKGDESAGEFSSTGSRKDLSALAASVVSELESRLQ